MMMVMVRPSAPLVRAGFSPDSGVLTTSRRALPCSIFKKGTDAEKFRAAFYGSRVVNDHNREHEDSSKQ